MRRVFTKPAFTLIELLVVIAIIAVLIALLLPALGKARRQSQLTQCMSNVRSVSAAMNGYAKDYRGEYPHWSGWHVYEGNGEGPDSPGLGWTEQLSVWLEGIEVFADPSREREWAPFSYFIAARYTWDKYAKAYVSLRDADVHFASQYVLGGDCNQPSLYVVPYGTAETVPDCDQDDASQPCVFFDGELMPHEGQSNLFFIDGHAATFREYEKSQMTWHATKMVGWELE